MRGMDSSKGGSRERDGRPGIWQRWRGLLGGWLAAWPWRQMRQADSEQAALAQLQSPCPRLRWEAAAALARQSRCSPEAVDALVAALADPEEFVRWQAAEALAAQDAEAVFPVLVEALSDPEPLRRAGAAEALGKIPGEASALAVSKRVADPDPRVRAAVARALGEARQPACISVLISLLEDDSPDVRREAAIALGRLGDVRAAGLLAAALAEVDQPLLVRRALAAALAHVPSPDAQQTLLATLSDPDPQVRGYAAQALGQAGDEQAYQALGYLLSDQAALLNGTVGDAARRAREMLERRGYGRGY